MLLDCLNPNLMRTWRRVLSVLRRLLNLSSHIWGTVNAHLGTRAQASLSLWSN